MWLSAALPGTERFTTTFESTASGVRRPPRQTDSIDIKIRRVCVDCNGGWMSRLEVAAAAILTPMVTGRRRVVLQRKEQRILAAWGMKVAMLWGFSGVPSIAPPRWELDHLYEHHEPPKSTYVWIGSFDGGTRDAVRIWHHHVELNATSLRAKPEGDLFTLRVGYFGMQVYRLPRHGQYGRNIGVIGGDPDSLRRVWPVITEVVRWPMPPLTDKQWEEIGRRFLTDSANPQFRPAPIR
jgi:hypothetical protein